MGLRLVASVGVKDGMRFIRPGLSAVISVLVCLTGLRAQPAPAEEAAVQPAGFRSHGDIRAVNVEEELASLRGANEGLVGSVPRQPMTFAAALAKARALAKAAVEPASFNQALKALPNNDPVTLRLFAVAQLAKGQPSAAFALLVAAYDRNPQSADALFDLAGMLAGFGYANESLAFLDELAARKAMPTPPMGISGRDATDYVRGYALARVGDVAAAKPLLKAVADHEPQLAEAARMMAILSEDEAEQRKYFLLGVWRHRSPQMVAAGVDLENAEPDAAVTGKEVAIDVRSLIDPAKAKRGRQPGMHYAQTVLQANDLVEKMAAAERAAEEQDSAISERRGTRPKGYIHTETDLQETWGYRMQQLVSAIDYRDAKIRELDRRRHVLWRERMEATRKITDQRSEVADKAVNEYLQACVAKRYNPTQEQIGEKARPAFEAALGQLLPYINREEQAERAWFAEWHYLATGLAAQVGDSAWHEYIRLSIEGQRWRSYRRLLELVDAHARIGQHPLITKEPGEVATTPTEEQVEKCDGSKSIGFGTNQLPGGKALPFTLGVSMTCEGMSLEAAVDTRIPGISISAEIGGDNQGNFTAFVGPKAEASLGDTGIAAFTGSAKAGAYVTGNRDGVTDAGVKYQVTAGANVGSFSASQTVAEGSVSFFPAPNSGGGDFGPLGG